MSRDISISKPIPFINNTSLVTVGYVLDICQLLSKYNLRGIINNLLLQAQLVFFIMPWKTLFQHAIANSEKQTLEQ